MPLSSDLDHCLREREEGGKKRGWKKRSNEGGKKQGRKVRGEKKIKK